MIENENKNKCGMIVVLIFLLICSGLGIAAFTMSFTKKCGERFDATCTNGNIKYPLQSQNLENFQSPGPDPDKIYGGWIYQGNNADYSKSCIALNNNINTLCPFGVINNNNNEKCNYNLAKIPSHIKNVWVTLGGAGITKGPTVDYISAYIKKNPSITGIIFDIEGWVDQLSTGDLMNYIQKLKSIGKKLKYIYAPKGDMQSLPSEKFLKNFDYVAPMLYSGSTSYTSKTDKWGFSNSSLIKYNCPRNLPPNNPIDTLAAKWAKQMNPTTPAYSKVILTVESGAATQCPSTSILTGIKQLVSDKNYAGVLIWPTGTQSFQSINDCKNLNKIIGSNDDCSKCCSKCNDFIPPNTTCPVSKCGGQSPCNPFKDTPKSGVCSCGKTWNLANKCGSSCLCETC